MNIPMRTVLLLLVGLLLLAVGANTADPVLSLTVTPLVGFEPQDIRVTIWVAQHADNRLLTIDIESEGFSTGSQEQLDGDKAPRNRVRWYRRVPGGSYDVVTRLYGTEGLKSTRAAQTRVIGIFESVP